MGNAGKVGRTGRPQNAHTRKTEKTEKTSRFTLTWLHSSLVFSYEKSAFSLTIYEMSF